LTLLKDGKTLFSRQFRYFLIQIILYRTTVHFSIFPREARFGDFEYAFY